MRISEQVISELAKLRQQIGELQAQVEQAHEMFRTISTNSPAGIYVVQEGKFQFIVTPQLLKLTGYDEGELTGRDSLTLVLPEDRGTVRENVMKMLKGEPPASYEFRYVTKGGEVRWALEIVSSIEYRGRRAILGSFVDITEQKLAEQLVRRIVSNSPAGISIVQEGRFQFVNPSFLEHVGWHEDEVLGSDARSFILPEDRWIVRGKAVRMLKGEHSSPYEYRTVNKSGKVRWVLERVSPIKHRGRRAHIGTFMDVTECRLTEKAPQEREERSKILLESAQYAPFLSGSEGRVSATYFGTPIARSRSGEEMLCPFVERNFSIDLDRCQVTVRGKPVKLSRTEYHLLKELFCHRGKVVSLAQLLTSVWGKEYKEEIECLRTAIWRLRLKIESNPHSPSYIRTIPGIGYIFDSPDPSS